MAEIIPGILEKNWKEVSRKIQQVKSFVKTIQIDFIDKEFTSNTTFLNPEPFKKYTRGLFLEAHLIVNDPINHIEKLARVGFKRFIGHIEKMPSQKEFIDSARKFGEAGLAIDAQTSLDRIKVDFNYPDCFTVMTVNAGFSGQALLPSVLKKIKTLRLKTKKPIEADGGINEDTIKDLAKLGVDRFLVNSALFEAENIEKQYQKLIKLITN